MLIVDTFNVLHAAPEVDPRLGGLTLDGLAHLLDSSRHGSLACVLVCDGTAGGRAKASSGGTLVRNVRAQYAGPGMDADSAIERLLDDQERKRAAHRCTVVSSDKRVKAAAAGVRAKWMSSRELVVQLIEDAERAQKQAEQRSGGKPPAVERAGRDGLDPESAAYWLAKFGYAAQPTKPAVKPLTAPGPRAGKAADDLVEQIRQEWGGSIDPDDLDMEKWLRGGKK